MHLNVDRERFIAMFLLSALSEIPRLFPARHGSNFAKNRAQSERAIPEDEPVSVEGRGRLGRQKALEQNKPWKDHQMRINEEAVSFSAFSLTKIVVAELLRKGILDREELISAIGREIDQQRTIAGPTNEDAATLLAVYCDEIQPRRHPDD